MHISAEDFIAVLKGEGLRITEARRAICAVIAAEHDDHLSPTEVHERAQAVAKQPIDPSTVYRTLEVFERLDLVHHVHLGHGPGVIHLTAADQHHHLTCDRCGSTTDVPAPALEPFFAELHDSFGFTVNPSHFALGGLCRECEHSENSG